MGDPSVLGAFSTITNINFGGQWLAFGALGSAFQGQTLTLDFPGQAGGTPGVFFFDDGVLPTGMVPAATFDNTFPNSLAGWPVIQSSYLSRSLKSGAGGAITGWGAGITQFGTT